MSKVRFYGGFDSCDLLLDLNCFYFCFAFFAWAVHNILPMWSHSVFPPIVSKITHWQITSSLCRNSKYNKWLWLCFSSDMTCVSECPAGTYAARQVADGSELGYCLPCDRACSSCTGASRQDCLTCSPGYLRLLELCVTHCPTGYKAASCLFTLSLLKKKPQ